METQAEPQGPSRQAEAGRTQMTRARAFFAVWVLSTMTLISVAVAVFVTRTTLQATLSMGQLLETAYIWALCAGGIYLIWRLARFARSLPILPPPS